MALAAIRRGDVRVITTAPAVPGHMRTQQWGGQGGLSGRPASGTCGVLGAGKRSGHRSGFGDTEEGSVPGNGRGSRELPIDWEGRSSSSGGWSGRQPGVPGSSPVELEVHGGTRHHCPLTEHRGREKASYGFDY